MEGSKPALLQVKDLYVNFETRHGRVLAVDGVSFDLYPREALGVVGESGCGKSVTALAIMRLLSQRSSVHGDVIFQGVHLLTAAEREMRRIRGGQIAMIFQDPMTSLNPVLTIERQMTEMIELHQHVGRAIASRRAVELLDLVGIPEPSKRVRDYPHQFSGGMLQRVMIATAISCGPKLLIADEPTTALDVTTQAQIIDLVNRLRRELDMAIIWISHDLGVVAGLCDRANVMYAGRIVESAGIEGLFSQTRHPYTLGLLKSIPRLDGPVSKRLTPIEGSPPVLSAQRQGCAFEPRCGFARDKCRAQSPELLPVLPGHLAACWVDVAAQSEPARLIGGSAN